MGHCVTGLISKAGTLEQFAQSRSLHAPVALGAAFAFLPLRDEDIDSFLKPPMSGHAKGFIYLSEQLERELASASIGNELMYFETEYFGGTGAQGAVVYRNGATVFGPISSEIGPINKALALLGVRVVAPARDEFESVGLHRHRHTEDWLEREGGG